MTFQKFISAWISFLLGATLYAQSGIKLDDGRLNIKEKTPLIEVLTTMSEQYELLLAYPSSLLNGIELDPQEYHFDTLDDLLAQLMADRAIEFSHVDEGKYLFRETLDFKPAYISVSGQVYDKETGAPLAWASVYLTDFSDGVFTDENGGFTMQVASGGQDSLVISYLAYDPLFVSTHPQAWPHTFRMKRSETVIEDVIVEYIVPPIMISNDGSFSILKNTDKDLINRPNLLNNDLLRNVQLMAGVSAHNDDEASLKIRGSNADQSLIIMDGMPLYNVDHYYGIFSSINADYVQDVSLYRNNQPINYIGTGGGLLLLDSHNNSEVLEGKADINLLSSSAYISIPVSSRFKLNVAGRSTYRNVDEGGLINLSRPNDLGNVGQIRENTFISNEPDFRFYDLNLRAQFDISDNAWMAYNFFKSSDRFSNDYDINFESEDSFVVFNETVYSNKEDWDNQAHSFQYEHRLSDNLTLGSNFHFTRYEHISELISTLVQNRNGTIMTESIYNATDSRLQDWGYELSFKIGKPDHYLMFGFDYNDYKNNNLFTVDDETVLNLNPKSNLLSQFAHYNVTVGKLNLQIANRLSNYHINRKNELILSPQLSGQFRLSDQHALKFSLGRSHQFLREIEYENRFSQTFIINALANGNQIPVLRTDNLMAGYSFSASGWSLDIELYKKYMDGAIQFSPSRPGFEFGQGAIPLKNYRIYKGERNVIGMDVMLSYKKNNYTSWLAYTLSRSRDAYPGIYQGKEFASQDDRRHQLKWINNLELGPFVLTNNVIYASGRPYLPLEILTTDQDRADIDPNTFIKKLPAYFRIDLGIEYGFNIGNTDAALSLTVFNITNRQNVKYLQYAYTLQNKMNQMVTNAILGTEAELLDRTLNFGFNISF